MTDFNLNQATGRTVEPKILKLLRALGRYIAKADYDHRQIARLVNRHAKLTPVLG